MRGRCLDLTDVYHHDYNVHEFSDKMFLIVQILKTILFVS